MAYIPSSNSVVGFQSQPSSLLVGASVVGLTPVNVVNMPSPSVIAFQQAGSVLAVSGNFTSGNTSVTAFQGGAWQTSISGGYVNVIGSVLVAGSIAAFQGTDPWKVNVPTSSYISYQLAGSVMAVSATVNTGNSSVQLLGGVAMIGSVIAMQGGTWGASVTGTMSVLGTVPVTQTTSPWVVNMPSPSVVAIQMAGSVMAVSGSFSGGNSSVELLSTSASIAVLVNKVLTGVSSVQLMAGTNNAGSITAIQGTNPWTVSNTSVVVNNIVTGQSSVYLIPGVGVLGSVATLQGTNPWVISNPSVTAFQGGTWAVSVVGGPLQINSTLGTYQEKAAAGNASVIGHAILFKNNVTTSTLATVSTLDPLPVIGSVATLQGTNPWIVVPTSGSVIATQIANSVMGVRTDSASVVAVLSNSSVAVLQGTNPWIINMPSPSVIALQLAGSVMAVNTTVTTGPSSVQLLSTSASIVTVHNYGYVSVMLMASTNSSVAVLASQNTNPWIVGSILGTYQERNATVASAFGIPILWKASDTTSVLSTVSYANPLPASVSGTVLTTNPNSSVMLTASTNHSVLTAPMYGYVSVMLMASTNSSVAVLASQGTNPWVIGSIVGTFAEDAAHTTADKGIFSLNVRNDTMSSVTSADGDYGALSVGPVGEAITANAPITKWFSQTASIMYGTSVQVVAAPGTSIFSYITGIHVMNESANASRVTITQGLGAVAVSILTRIIAPAGGGSNSNYINGIRVLDNNGISASISGVSSVLLTITGFNSKT